jgi:O-acetylhomoserine (thiol)-lyase
VDVNTSNTKIIRQLTFLKSFQSIKNMGFSTKILQTGFNKSDKHGATQMPIYSNAAFGFGSAEQMEMAFQGFLPDHIYSRISNPTVENLEQRVKSITGAQAVTAVSSGMAAISNVMLAIAESGSNIVTSNHLFGNTYSLFKYTLKSLGIEFRFCDFTNPSTIKKSIDRKTIAIFFETITNPQLEVSDISYISSLAKKNKLVLISDTTLTPPNIFNAGKWGIDIEVVSSTKIMSGGATSIGGLIIDYGTFDWSSNKKFSDIAKRFGPHAFNYKLRKEVYRNLGACLSPYHAYLQSVGLETLDMRFEKAAGNCLKIARFLQNEKHVTRVDYPGLENSPFYTLSRDQFGQLPGSVLTFRLKTREACFAFMNKLKIITRATNINDNRTLILHPASTIFSDFDQKTRENMGIPDTLIRLSVGIEDMEDLTEDIKQALN